MVCELCLNLKINFQSKFLYPKYQSMYFLEFFFYKHFTHLKLMSNLCTPIIHEECYMVHITFIVKEGRNFRPMTFNPSSVRI